MDTENQPLEDMEVELPKRVFPPGHEPLVTHINNNCKMSTLKALKALLPAEYKKLKTESVFAPIIAIYENELNFSARLIHSFVCRQLVTSKVRELWFVCGRRPLRFSLQEFHAITGLNCEQVDDSNFSKWKDDGGDWSKLLKRKEKISLMTLQNKYDVRKWSIKDRMRYAYINVITGLVLGRDGKAIIPEIYMKVVMDTNKIESYPWGVKAFKLLVDSVFKAREKLVKEKDCNSYVLDGLTYALQIWIMEAIPDFGIMMGNKINKELIQGPRCSNWTGAAKASYEEISRLECAFGSETVMYPYLSSTGNYDVFDSASFVFSDEFRDCRVNKLNKLIRSGYDWSDYIWGVEESAQISEDNEEKEPDLENAFVDDNDEVRTPPAEDSYVNNSRRSKKKQPDHGAEARKRKLLCQRLESKQQPLGEDMKALLQSLFAENFSPMEKRLHDRLDQMETEIKSLKETINLAGIQTGNTSKAVNVEESQPKRQDDQTDDGNSDASEHLFDVFMTQASTIDPNMGTQEYLEKAIGKLPQDSIVSDFDPPKSSQPERPKNWFTPSTSFKAVRGPVPKPQSTLGDMWTKRLLDEPALADSEPGDVLHLVPADKWRQVDEWSMSRKCLQLGPIVFSTDVASRVMDPSEWLHNDEIDAIMYIFREKTNLQLWDQRAVAFLNTLFTAHVTTSYNRYLKDKRGYKVDQILLSYGTGSRPSHGRTNQVWGIDVERLYIPYNVNGNHWISMFVNITRRTIEVFDCAGKKNKRSIEPFAFAIPRIVKAVHPAADAKQMTVTPYTISHAPMKSRLNKSACDCGVYALKFIECHLLGVDMSLVDDEVIRWCRQKITFDLWEAANDPVLTERMANYEPEESDSTVLHVD